MNNVTLRKYFMSKIDSLQREVEFLKESVTLLDAESAPEVEAPVKAETKKTEPKKAAAKKEEKAPETKKEEKAQDPSDDDLFGDEKQDDELGAPTIDDVRAVVKEFSSVKGKEKAMQLLGKFGADSISKIDKKDYEAIIKLAKRYL